MDLFFTGGRGVVMTISRVENNELVVLLDRLSRKRGRIYFSYSNSGSWQRRELAVM